MSSLFVKNDNDVFLKGMRNPEDNSYVNDAVLTFTVYDDDCNVMSGADGVSMSYVAASNGVYRGVLESSVDLIPGKFYNVVIVSSNYDYQTDGLRQATKRTF